ncbi:MAG TPA: UDP-N-acetylmuramate--L-alanine ligase [Candidatus Moranbacteria bacterium]|nr:UDP-N-acetylmuramate--L-alanine ligase [Candidatus Moranbacteria bacterium]HRZ33753.1 UDP-N-acetylmuramate--L-alanine ligase [Candidatus Moranbacteria bacterium]
MEIKDISKAYLIGIKGAGMVSVAQILQSRNIEVSGSDTGEIFYTDAILKRCKIPFFEQFAPEHIPQDADLVIYSTAYNKENNVEIAEAEKMGITLISYPEFLGMLLGEKLGIAVSGTHGKTTTSAMLAEVLKYAELNPSAIIGSQVISWQGSALAGKGDYFIAEADEYQNKLQYYNPWSVILTSVDWDHPDFFHSFSEYKKVFEDFVQKIPKTGFLIVWGDSSSALEVAEKANCSKVTYGYSEDCDYKIVKQDGLQKFEVFYKEENLGLFEIALIGKHNVLNATAVIALCHQMGVNMEKVRESLKNFKGTSRRFEKIGMFGKIILIDDYAHHPDEIKATLEGAREYFKEKTIWTVFHPHTFSRTKALLSEFAQSFDDTEKVIIIDIYGSAREKQGGVSSNDLVNLINKYQPGKAEYVPHVDEVIEYLKEKSGQYDVLITMGAGDVWKIGEKLKNL